ncbi:hypothetical protein PF008_g32824 [Phytophthora fragariae]|uniref:ABC transmembrane type-1 domain-containing protein n=1 Tax=Phytophthora fragariae TaxID=53985 RepID=A0A6G0PZ78_9STRA|nr:hypothetical protein PF008_g32824 [Phytophthora fragariae]
MDKALLGLGVVMAGVGGALFPCMALVFGNAINSFAQADGGVDRDALFPSTYSRFVVQPNMLEKLTTAQRIRR